MNRSISFASALTAFAAAALLAAPSTAQTVHYSTGFEPPTFAPGPFVGSNLWDGVDGWLATGDAFSDPDLSKMTAQSAVVHTGTQTAAFDATGQTTSYAHIRRHVFVNATQAEPFLDIAFDMRIASSSTQSEWGIQSQCAPGPGSGLLEWWIDVAGQLHMTSATGGVATGVVLNRDQWYRMLTRVDFNAQTYSVLVDGQVAGTVAALPAAQFWAHAFTSLMFIQPGNDRMYVDNFSVSTHDGSVVSSYCTAGTSTHGCSAALSSSGTPIASASSGFSLQATNVEGAVNAMFFYGVQGRIANPWASGSTSFVCVKSPTQRTLLANTGGAAGSCAGTASFDFLAFMATHPAALGQPIHAGQVFDAQLWYRDPPAPKSTNLSDALEFVLVP